MLFYKKTNSVRFSDEIDEDSLFFVYYFLDIFLPKTEFYY